MDALASIKVLRPFNGLMASFATAIGYWASLERFSLSQPLLLALVAAFFVCGAGQALNDYFDRAVDRKIKPDRPIPSGRLPAKFVLAESLSLFAAGNALAFQVNPAAFAISVVFTLLLIAYSALLKNIKYVGNWVVAAGTAVTLVFGASLSGAYQAVLFLAFSAFLANLGRELTKDLEDMEGDRGHKMTLPLLAGKTPVKSIVLFCYAFALAVGLFAGFRFYFEETWFLPLLLLSGLVFGHASGRMMAGDFRGSQGFAKKAMLLSLLAFASVVL